MVWIATGKGKLLGLLEEDQWPFILVDRLFFSLTHIEGITLGAGEEVDEVDIVKHFNKLLWYMICVFVSSCEGMTTESIKSPNAHCRFMLLVKTKINFHCHWQ